jgi:hypothetical protein
LFLPTPPPPDDKFLDAWNMSGFATCGFFTRDALYTFISDVGMHTLPTPSPVTVKLSMLTHADPLTQEGVDYRDLYFPKNRSYVLLGVNQVSYACV